MKRTALFAALLLAWAGPSSAQTWEAGLTGGYRTIKDESLRRIYGNGFVYTPYLSLAVSKTLRVGAEYEFGYVKNAKIGLFEDPSTLKVRGGHLFLQYGERSGRFQPFFKVGLGLYAFQFDVEIPSRPALRVADTDVSFYFGAGLRIAVTKHLIGTTELKYAALWVDSYDDQVDLGGIRILLGIGYGF
ncbi:MAG: outer membrane beta-barrel protein [Candidatus Aminicenantes bacterium]|nr:outer membrane beta-barrel protein [Candidatus Aminicenantes bacterium]